MTLRWKTMFRSIYLAIVLEVGQIRLNLRGSPPPDLPPTGGGTPFRTHPRSVCLDTTPPHPPLPTLDPPLKRSSAVSITVSSVYAAWSSSDVFAIRNNILSTATYSPAIRPSENTTVRAGLSVLTINDLDWTDSRLTWNTTTYPDVSTIHVKEAEVWTPEFFVDNSVADASILSDKHVLLVVKSTGELIWSLPRIFTVHCDIDVTYYPFDTQTCAVELTSWAYAKPEMQFAALRTHVNLEDLKQDGEWDIKSSTVEISDIPETKTDGSIVYLSRINFHITLQRKFSYYVTSILLPVLLISYLNSIVFILPVQSGGKIGCTLTILLALSVLLTLITDSIPSTSLHICILSTYLATVLCIGASCCLLTVIIIRIYHLPQTKERSPSLLTFMNKVVIPLSCWNGCCKGKACRKNKDNTVEPSQNHKKEAQSKNFQTSPKYPLKGTSEKNVENHPSKDNDGTEEIPEMEKDYTWNEIACMLDWFFFVTTIAVTTVMTIVFFMALALGGSVNT
ncbi:hypothetical protein FSP39_017784 [Pinctada imbricata]|uniref:Uncharacterized protein n=1 Tax=Pinctada imbricata TaxID=66713 RepID=A0AA89BUZ9_PINIB|nr:hypothetical protein FSP39_017784 [Pinctada imbricata]